LAPWRSSMALRRCWPPELGRPGAETSTSRTETSRARSALGSDRGWGMPGRNWGRRLMAGAALAYAATRAAKLRRRADLRGQVALIVGGSRGLGLALACELAAAGCRLVIAARDEHELAEARRVLEAQGAEVVSCRCDVGNRADIDRAVAAAEERFGAIDLLVNVAGLIQVGPAESMT